MMEQLTTLGIFEDQVKLLMILKRVKELHDERMSVDAFQNVALGFCLLDDSLVDNQ